MKTTLKIACTTLAIGLFATQVSHAGNRISLNPSNASPVGLHDTVISLTNPAKTANIDVSLFYGQKFGTHCFKKQYLGGYHGEVYDGTTLYVNESAFAGQKLNKRSCAVEVYTVKGSKQVGWVSYALVNDGTTVTQADPDNQTLTLNND